LKRFIAVLSVATLGACGGGETGTTPSSGGTLEIQELVVGTGATATVGSTVTVNYIGMFTNGSVFDSSYDRGQPIQFVVGAGQLIPGFEQGVVGMKVGGKRRLTIPPSLAYGSAGYGPIPGNTTVVFDVELVSIP
jgi:FKBP-type peptidyl-prolyl cis-trans isomerase